MKLKNYFVPESFVWNGQSEENFVNATRNLDAVVCYLQNLNEPIYGSDDLYWKEILPETPIYNFYEQIENDPYHDEKQMIMLILQEMKVANDEDFDDQIGLQFYMLAQSEGEETGRQAFGLPQYSSHRRDILVGIEESHEFSTFMKTCFPDIIFSDDIEKGIHDIDHFESAVVRNAIVNDLGVLNDEALLIYERHHPKFEEMYKELSAKVLACSPDSPEHKKYLTFSFSYSLDDGTDQIKGVFCSPHTKLIRKDSNLRIYFAWQDADVGGGKKVLVGRIGGHPYPKGR